MAVVGYFPATLAVDSNTGTRLRNAEAQVYAITDQSFSSPLAITDMAGVPFTGNKLVSNSDGIYPEFKPPSGVTQVIVKSGQALTPMTSIAVYAAAAEDAASAAQGAAGTASTAAGTATGAASTATTAAAQAVAVGNSNDTIIEGRIKDPASKTAQALTATIDAAVSAGAVNSILPLATEVDAYGESTTAGAKFETDLAAYTGLAVTNRGTAGQGVADELARMGGIRPLVTLAGPIPATTTAVNVTTINPSRGWRVGGGFGVTGYLGGVRGSLAHNGAGAFTFTRSSAGDALTVPPNTPFIRDAALTTPTRRLLFWGGRNNVTDGTMPVLAEMVALIRDAQATRAKEILVLGVVNGTAEGTGTTGYKRIRAYNDRLKQIFGDQFYDVRTDFIARGLQIRGIDPTATDSANIAADKPPASLMADNIHPNADGYLAINYLVAEKMLALGWITSVTLPEIPIAITWNTYTSDSFNRADGTPGTTDAAAGGAAQTWNADGQLGVVSNRLAATAALTANRYARLTPGRQAAIELDWTEGTGINLDVCWVDNNNRYTFTVATGGGTGIYRRVSGTNTPVATGSENAAPGDRLRLEAYFLADGTTLRLRVKRNGAVIAQYDDTSPLTGTSVRVGSQFSGSPWSVDNLVVQTRA